VLQFKDARDEDYIRQQFEELANKNYDARFDDEIVTALEQLPFEFKTVVVLADIESFSYKEIAQIVGCPIGTVMSRLSRARTRLQELLKDYAIESGIINSSQNIGSN
jgi:RNA polymerase sigma-70 factor (ECF subfamily)